MKKLAYQLPFFIAILLYLAALGLTGISSGEQEFPGIYCLIGGWLAFLNEISAFIAWLGNIAFFLAIKSVVKRKKEPKIFRGLIYSALSVGLGLFGLTIGMFKLTDSGDRLHNAELEIGYYVWIASFIIMLISMILRLKAKKTK